jgi:hypothetical protein
LITNLIYEAKIVLFKGKASFLSIKYKIQKMGGLGDMVIIRFIARYAKSE